MNRTRTNYGVSGAIGIAIVISLGLALCPAASAANWGVDTTAAPVANWLSLSAGESRWYAFEYVGDGSEIQVSLQVMPAGSTGFVVWTPSQIERWGTSRRLEPIGRGSDDPFVEGGLTWSGCFPEAGTYYVVVEQESGFTGPSWYLLEIEGQGVSFSAPITQETVTKAAEATAEQPTQSAPKSALVSELEGQLVFQTTYGGPFYTIDVDGTNLRHITNGIDPVWSPDGEQIAFVRWENPRGLWVIDLTSGHEWRVFDWSEMRYPSWSPDGEEIVFSRQKSRASGGSPDSLSIAARRPPGRAGGGASASAGWALGIVRPSGDAFWEPLPCSDTNLTPDWSPDGELIVLAGTRGLMVQSVDGQESYALTGLPQDNSPAWSPDGSQVAFVRRQHDHWEIYVAGADGRGLRRLTDTPALLDGTAAHSVSPAWSPDGQYLAFLTDRTGEWEVWVMRSDGTDQGPLFGTELDGLTLDYAFAGERALDWTW